MKNKKRKAWKRQKTSYEIGTDRITSLAIQGNLHVLKDNEVYLMHNNMALVSAKMYEALTGNKPMTTSDILIPKTLLDEYEKFKCKLMKVGTFLIFIGLQYNVKHCLNWEVKGQVLWCVKCHLWD